MRKCFVFQFNCSDLNCIAHQTGNVVNIQALHYLGAMTFDSLYADIQSEPDLSRRLTLNEQFKYFALPRRQPLDQALLAARAPHAIGQVFQSYLAKVSCSAG